MSQPTTREEFKQWCLRKLGEPVTKVNCENTQVEDRIDEALQTFFKYHADGSKQATITYTITDEDIINNYITLPDNVFSISRIVPMSSGGGIFDRGIFDVRYRIHLSELYSQGGIYRGGNLAYYDMQKSNLALIDRMFNIQKSFRYNRYENKIHFEESIANIVANEGNQICFRAYTMLDVENNYRVWSDDWLQDYTTALIKQQWGMNLMKYSGVQMIGGVTLNGTELFQQGTEEIRELEEKLKSENQMPPLPFFG